MAPLGALTALPYYLARSITRPEYREHVAERFGIYPRELARRLDALPERPVWIQAVSVGEVLLTRGLIDGMRHAGVSRPVIVSSTTPAGRRMAAESLARATAGVFHFPIDWRPITRRALRILRPAVYVSVETELWPGLLTALERAGRPVIVVNGRISDRTRDRYARLGGLMRGPIRSIRLACMQSPADAGRLESLGLAPDRIVVTGNIKFDTAIADGSPGSARDHFALSWDPVTPTLVAGSTSAGEEEQVIDAVRRSGVPALNLVIAPRHPERFEEVARLLTSRAIPFVRRSRPAPGPHPPTLLLDTLGELRKAYGMASVAFVGGSLVRRGGQNLLEPAAWGVPMLFGPHTESFEPIARALIDAGAGTRVADAAGLAAGIRSLLADETARVGAGAAGRALIEEHRGATDRTIRHLLPLLR